MKSEIARAVDQAREHVAADASVPSRNVQVPPSCQTGGCSSESRNCSSGMCGATKRREDRDEDDETRKTEADDRAAVLAEIVPELAQRAGRARGLACVGGASSSLGSVRSAIGSPHVPDARIDEAVEHIDRSG